MTILKLFFAFLQVGLFSLGGGYVAIPLIQAQAVQTYGWLTADEFSNLVTIAEMTPGPIALNAATFVGQRIAGLPGALVATFGCILPSLVIVSILSFLYRKYKEFSAVRKILASLRPVVVALIASAGLSIFLQAIFPGGEYTLANFRYISLILFAGALFLIRKLKWSPILSMLLCGAAALLIKALTEM